MPKMTRIMARAERPGRSGHDLPVGIVLASELEQPRCGVSHPGLREMGWHHAILTAAAAPIAAERMRDTINRSEDSDDVREPMAELTVDE
jgi:hypothetical protein